MSGWVIVRRAVAVVLLVLWMSQVLGVAVFAIPTRFDGLEAVFLSLLTLVIGLVPIMVVLYVFRDRASAAPVTSTTAPPPGVPPPAVPPPSPLLEPLSERELEILA